MNQVQTRRNRRTSVGDPRQRGRLIVPGNFVSYPGRGLRDIIDPLGRTYHPHVYDIPQWKYRILAFCVDFILMLIQTGVMGSRINFGAFDARLLGSQDDITQLHGLLTQIRNNIIFFDSHRGIDGVEWDQKIKLLDPSIVSKVGTPCAKEDLLVRTFRRGSCYSVSRLNLPSDTRLVIVTTVKGSDVHEKINWGGSTWRIAFDVTDGSGRNILEQVMHHGHYVNTKFFVLPTEKFSDPKILAKNQSPQFVTYSVE